MQSANSGLTSLRFEIPRYGGHATHKQSQRPTAVVKQHPTFHFISEMLSVPVPASVWIRFDDSKVWMAVEEKIYGHILATFLADEVDFFIIVRPTGSNSPNTSPTASAITSIASTTTSSKDPTRPFSRQSKSSASRSASRADSMTKTPPKKFSAENSSRYFSTIERMRLANNSLDPIYFEPIEETPMQEQITIADADDRTTLVVPIESMIALIKNASENATSPFETVILCPETNKAVVLDVEVWKRWLVRGNAAQEEFMAMFVDAIQIDSARGQFSASLRTNNDLFWRLCAFISDLKVYGCSSVAAGRIDSIPLDAPMKFGWPYFDHEEVRLLLAAPLHPNTNVNDALAKRIEAKSLEVCASHDMAPFLIRAFSIGKGEMEKTGFKKFYDNFRGLPIDGDGSGKRPTGKESGMSDGSSGQGGESSGRHAVDGSKQSKKEKARRFKGKEGPKELGQSAESSVKGKTVPRKGK